MLQPILLGADQSGGAREEKAETDKENDGRAVEEAFESGKVGERHNKLLFLQSFPLGGARGCPIWTVLK